MNKIDGYHAMWWNRPGQHIPGEYEPAPYKVLTWILSALEWRKHNGDMKLYTNRAGYKYFEDKNLLGVWNRGVDTELVENIPFVVRPEIFWAGAKIYAMEQEPMENACLDTDHIVWHEIECADETDLLICNRELIVDDFEKHHGEDVFMVGSEIYPDDIYLPENYYLEFDLESNNTAYSTAITYFNNEKLKNTYIKEARRYMESIHHNRQEGELIDSRVLFSEQRTIALIAEGKYRVRAINDSYENPKSTHVATFKKRIGDKPKYQYWFYKTLLRRLRDDFPNYYAKILDAYPSLLEYHDELDEPVNVDMDWIKGLSIGIEHI